MIVAGIGNDGSFLYLFLRLLLYHTVLASAAVYSLCSLQIYRYTTIRNSFAASTLGIYLIAYQQVFDTFLFKCFYLCLLHLQRLKFIYIKQIHHYICTASSYPCCAACLCSLSHLQNVRVCRQYLSRRNNTPFIFSVSSIVSRVVPAISLTMARSSFSNALSKVLLPALGLPIIATLTPLRITLPNLKESDQLVWQLLSFHLSSVYSCVRSANSTSSWLKSSSSSISALNFISCSRICFQLIAEAAAQVMHSCLLCCCTIWLAIRSATASACVRSMLTIQESALGKLPAFAICAPLLQAQIYHLLQNIIRSVATDLHHIFTCIAFGSLIQAHHHFIYAFYLPSSYLPK